MGIFGIFEHVFGIWDVFFKFGRLRGEGGEGWRCMYSRSGRGGRQAERLRWFGWEGRLPTSPERLNFWGNVWENKSELRLPAPFLVFVLSSSGCLLRETLHLAQLIADSIC